VHDFPRCDLVNRTPLYLDNVTIIYWARHSDLKIALVLYRNVSVFKAGQTVIETYQGINYIKYDFTINVSRHDILCM